MSEPGTGTDRPTSMTRGERVRATGRTLRTPRTAAWVADETDVSVKTATKYLDQLVEDAVLRRIERGESTVYCVDQLMARYRDVASLQRDHDQEELTNALQEMRTQVTTWQAEYGVETPAELRATIADLDDPDAMETRRTVAAEWTHVADRIPVVQAALRQYDWVTDRALSA